MASWRGTLLELGILSNICLVVIVDDKLKCKQNLKQEILSNISLGVIGIGKLKSNKLEAKITEWQKVSSERWRQVEVQHPCNKKYWVTSS